MSKQAKNDTLTEITRAAIASCGLTLYDLGEQAGVDRTLLGRFRDGRQTITLRTFDRINEVLKLRTTRR